MYCFRSDDSSYPPDVGDTGFVQYGGNSGSFNVLTCTINTYSVAYNYTNGTFMTLSKEPTDLNMSLRFAASLSEAVLFGRIPIAVEGAGVSGGSYVDSYALELSREIAAYSAFLYQPAAVTSPRSLSLSTGSQLQLVPLILLLATMGMYW